MPTYAYTVQRNLNGAGARSWLAGDSLANTGKPGNGYIHQYATAGRFAGAGPTMVGMVRTGTAHNAVQPRWAIGHLNGLYGVSGSVYGSAFGDAQATNLIIDTQNGIRIRHGITNKLHADTSGNLNLTGNLILGTAGVFRSGATAFATGIGYWLDYNAGQPRMRVGNPAGDRLQWDGSALVVKSSDVTIDSGGIVLPPAANYYAPSAYKIRNSSTDTGAFGLWGSWVDDQGPWTLKAMNLSAENLHATDPRAQLHLLSASGSGGSRGQAVLDLWGKHPSGVPYAQLALTTGFTTHAKLELLSTGVAITGAATLNSTLQFTTNTGGAPSGGLAKNATNGLHICPVAGSSYDLAITNAANSAYCAVVPAGTTSLRIVGQLIVDQAMRFDGPNQTTVGAAGAAAALPANPVGYLVINYAGTEYVIPAYNKA
jgi:hypothetical protein